MANVPKPSPPSYTNGGGGISEEYRWLKDTRWNWNNWREVIFRADGSFLAPAENCERETLRVLVPLLRTPLLRRRRAGRR